MAPNCHQYHATACQELKDSVDCACSEVRVGGMLGGKAGLTYCHMGTAASRLEPLRAALAAAPGLPRRALAAHLGLYPCPHPSLSARGAVCCMLTLWLTKHRSRLVPAVSSCSTPPNAIYWQNGKMRTHSLLPWQDIHRLML